MNPDPALLSSPTLAGTPAAAELLAAIDIGAHRFRLEIARLEGRRYHCLQRRQEVVRLGEDGQLRGRLSEEAMRRGIACLERFGQHLQGLARGRVRAVATQALGGALNLDEFLGLGAAALGQPIELLSAREEARLIYTGVAGLGPPSAERRLVIDIGGRATEMVLGEGSSFLLAESFPVGSTGLSERFFAEGRFTQAAFQAAQVAAGAALEEAREAFVAQGWSEAFASSDTALAVSQLLVANRITDGAITREGLHWCIEQCLEAGRVSRLEMAGLQEAHGAFLGGGLSILMALLTQFEIEAFLPTQGTLGQGLVFDLGERLSASLQGQQALDSRHQAVRQLQQRFQVDRSQAQRVQELACRLHAVLDPQSEAAARTELAWAAALHEMGMVVSHHDHHRHGAYLLTHADAPGFSQSQQRRLGILVLGQRGRLRKIEAALAEPAVVSQVLALRLAVLLCQARSAPPAAAVRVSRLGRTVVVSLQADWAQDNAHMLYRLQEERTNWEHTGIVRLAIKIERRG